MDNNLENIIKDEDFLKNVINMSMEEAQEAFKMRGVSFSKDDMISIRNLVQAKISGQNTASDEILSKIAGGRVTDRIKNIAIAISALAVGGSVAAISYKGYKTLGRMSDTMDNLSKNASNSMEHFNTLSASATNAIETAGNAIKETTPQIKTMIETTKGTVEEASKAVGTAATTIKENYTPNGGGLLGWIGLGKKS